MGGSRGVRPNPRGKCANESSGKRFRCRIVRACENDPRFAHQIAIYVAIAGWLYNLFVRLMSARASSLDAPALAVTASSWSSEPTYRGRSRFPRSV